MRTVLASATVGGVLLLSFACKPDPEVGDSGSVEACAVSVADTLPQSGSTSAYYRGSFEAELSEADATATISMAGPDGDVPGETTWRDDVTAVFTPSAPLAPNTEYTATISFCAGDVPVSFTTSEVGLATDVALTDRTYLISLASARVLEPAGVGKVIQDYLTSEMLVGVVSDAGGLEMIGAVAEEGAAGNAIQAPCSPTVDFPPSGFADNPYFEASTPKMDFVVADTHILIHDLFLSGAFAPDGTYIANAVLRGTVDTRPLVGLISEDASENAGCELAETLNVSCEPCPDGEVFCLTLLADSISATYVEGQTLYPIEDECDLDWCQNDEDCVEAAR